MKENYKVRNLARVLDVPQWKIATALGISEATLTRWLRFPLSPDRESKIMEVIEQLAQKKQEVR